MKKLFLMLLVILGQLSNVLAGAPLRIVCIGDSITQGRGTHSITGEAWQSTDGWRYTFWKYCVAAGYPVEMVGSIDTGFQGTPDYPDFKGEKFNNRHEAHWGWNSEQLAHASWAVNRAGIKPE